MRILKELRKQKRITQEKLAKDLALSRSAISMYEIDASEPDFEITCKIADYFGVTVDYLLGRCDSPEISANRTLNGHVLLKLRDLRKMRNKTQKDIADYLHVTPQTITGYESGHREPNIETLLKLANFFDVSVDFLLGYDNLKKIKVSNIARGGEISEEVLTQGEVESATWLIQNKDKNAVIFFSEGQIVESIELSKEKIIPAISLIKTLKEVR